MTGSCTQNIHLVDNGAGQKQDERRLFRRRARDLVRGKDHPFGAATHSCRPFTSRGSRTGSRRRGQQAEVGAVQPVTGVGKVLLGELMHHLGKEGGGMTIVEPQKHLQNKSTHFQSKRLPRSLQQNLLIFAGVLVSRANGSSFGVRPEYSVIEDRYRERVWRFSQLQDLL